MSIRTTAWMDCDCDGSCDWCDGLKCDATVDSSMRVRSVAEIRRLGREKGWKTVRVNLTNGESVDLCPDCVRGRKDSAK